MQSIKISLLLLAGEKCLKVEDSETKEERGTTCFQIPLNQIWTFSYVHKSYACCHMHICSKSYYIHFACNCLLLLSTILFVYQFVPPCEVSYGTVFLYACVSSAVHIYVSFSLLFYFHWKSDCDVTPTLTLYLLLHVFSVITIIVKLL